MASKRAVMAELSAKHAAMVRERLVRERANIGDVVEFVTQQSREEQVNVWLELGVGRLEGEAARRREKCRALAGAALAAMIDRGQSVKVVAELAGIPAAKVQEYLALAQSPPVNGAAAVTDEKRWVGRLERENPAPADG